MGKYNKFERELTTLINIHSMEQESNTPDYILARLMVGTLELYEQTLKANIARKKL